MKNEIPSKRKRTKRNMKKKKKKKKKKNDDDNMSNDLAPKVRKEMVADFLAGTFRDHLDTTEIPRKIQRAT